MTKTPAPFAKTAVDDVAETYWEDYFKEYGALWVRKIPRRIKAELLKSTKTAAKSAGQKFDLKPVASVFTDDGVSLEALAKIGSALKLVRADFSHDGELTSFAAVDVK